MRKSRFTEAQIMAVLRQVEGGMGLADVLAEQRVFMLSPEKWEQFQAALDAPPRDIPRMRKLMLEPSIFEKSGKG